MYVVCEKLPQIYGDTSTTSSSNLFVGFSCCCVCRQSGHGDGQFQHNVTESCCHRILRPILSLGLFSHDHHQAKHTDTLVLLPWSVPKRCLGNDICNCYRCILLTGEQADGDHLLIYWQLHLLWLSVSDYLIRWKRVDSLQLLLIGDWWLTFRTSLA